MKGCGVLVCPGTKFCSRLQSFVLRGRQNVAGTGGSRLGRRREERVCSVYLNLLVKG